MSKRKKPNYETMNHRARRSRYEGSGRKAQLNRIYLRDKGICQICYKPCERAEASRDHIKDFALCTPEEARSDDNVQLAHIICNERKHYVPKSRIKVANPYQPRLSYTLGSVSPVLERLYMEQRECHVITISLHDEKRETINHIAELISDITFGAAENDTDISFTRQEECDHLE